MNETEEKEVETTGDNTLKETTSIEQPANEIETTSYDKYFVEVNGKNVPLYVDIQQGSRNEDWIKFEKYEDGYLIKINFENYFIGNNFNSQDSKAASNAIAIVLATSMLKAEIVGRAEQILQTVKDSVSACCEAWRLDTSVLPVLRRLVPPGGRCIQAFYKTNHFLHT